MMPRTLRLKTLVIKLSDDHPDEDIHEMVELVRHHVGGVSGQPVDKVKIDVKCNNGKTVHCEVGGFLEARDCAQRIGGACGAEGGTATFSGLY